MAKWFPVGRRGKARAEISERRGPNQATVQKKGYQVRLVESGGSTTASALTLPFEKASVPRARRMVGAELRGQGLPGDLVSDIMLVVSELVGNALRHARPLPTGDVKVSWAVRDRDVRVSVTDGGGPTSPRILKTPVSALGGRGLSIVAEMSATWGVERSATTSTVYATLPF